MTVKAVQPLSILKPENERGLQFEKKNHLEHANNSWTHGSASRDSNFVYSPRSFSNSCIPSLLGTKFADMILELRGILVAGADSRPIDLLDEICRTLEDNGRQCLQKNFRREQVDCAVQIDINFDDMKTNFSPGTVDALESDDDSSLSFVLENKPYNSRVSENTAGKETVTFSQHQWHFRQSDAGAQHSHSCFQSNDQYIRKASTAETLESEINDNTEIGAQVALHITQVETVVHPSDSDSESHPQCVEEEVAGIDMNANTEAKFWVDSALCDLAAQNGQSISSNSPLLQNSWTRLLGSSDSGCTFCRKAASELAMQLRWDGNGSAQTSQEDGQAFSNAQSNRSAHIRVVCGGCGCFITADADAPDSVVDRRLCL